MKEALQTYKKAFNLDETSVPALAGIIHCHIVEGQLGEAEQQLREVQSSIGKQANLLFLTALLAHKKGQPHGGVMKALEEVVDVPSWYHVNTHLLSHLGTMLTHTCCPILVPC